MNINASAFEIIRPGVLSQIQDAGRFGSAPLGLTQSGAADGLAYEWLNRLLNNEPNASAIEIAMGGIALKAHCQSVICVTGANAPLTINGVAKDIWTTHQVNIGDTIELGFCKEGVRSYLGVAGGFDIAPQFGSAATVIREGIGGLTHRPGTALQAGDRLPIKPMHTRAQQVSLALYDRPTYANPLTLRVIPSYQQHEFSRLQQRRFYSHQYHVSKQWDRMGVRLQGPAIEIETSAMLSEGIALGAIQVPPDGQPIILMQDRQTIGGYPKLGAVLSLDVWRLAQCGQGATIQFEAISMDHAHNLLHLHWHKLQQVKLLTKEWQS